jgi:outer membrane receptor protein involved in Fe transport
MGQLQNPYSRPGSEVKLNSTYNIGDKFLLRADLFYIGERKGGITNPTSGNKDNISEIKLDPFVDLNLGIDYRYNKNVSVFLNFNNMAAARYMRFTNYDVYGFNALGGVTLTF